MVYGAILDKGEKFYTDMSKAINALNGRVKDYNWLVTDFEFNEALLTGRDYAFLTGEELTDFADEPHFQWIWAIVSGFRKEIQLDEILKYPLPYADGYRGFWQNPLSIQHPLAEIEIVPWDSSLTLFISKHKDLVDMYRRAFPLSRDLAEYNSDV